MPFIQCPSGLAGQVRNLKVKEADALADTVEAKQGTSFDSVLAGCWLRTDSPGVYEKTALRSDGSLDWSKVYLADRFHALLRIRAATYGEDYDFDVPKCTGCDERYGWSLRLEDLPVKPLPEETRALLVQGTNSFETSLPDGRRVLFHLQTGEREAKAVLFARKQPRNKVTMSLLARVDEIGGVRGPGLRAVVEDLSMPETLHLLEQFDAVDGGVETDIATHCPHCGFENVVELPLGKGFWIPKKTQKPSF